MLCWGGVCVTGRCCVCALQLCTLAMQYVPAAVPMDPLDSRLTLRLPAPLQVSVGSVALVSFGERTTASSSSS